MKTTDQEPTASDTSDLPTEVAWLVREGFSRIRAWREHLGVTREELGERLGSSAAAVAQLEAKHAKPRAAMLKKVAAALELPDWERLKG